MLKNVKLGTKIIAGYLLLIAFVIATGSVGFWGTKTVAKSLHIVGSEEAPLVDMAKEMKISLITARNTMEEFKAASAALATDDASVLEEIQQTYQQTLDEFDSFADAILEGATFDNGYVVIKTDNEELAELVRLSDDIHNNKFQVAASEMIQAGRDLLARKADADSAMVSMEEACNLVSEGADQLETAIKDTIETKEAVATTAEEVKDILNQWVPYIDCAMELKFAISASRIVLEEVAQATDLESITELEPTFAQTVIEFDEIVVALQDGGEVDGDTVYKIEDQNLLDMIASFDGEHTTFQEACATMFAAQKAMIAKAVQAEAAMAALDTAGEETADLLDKVAGLAGAEMSTAKAEGATAVNVSITWIIASIVAATVIGLLTGVLISRGITKPINRIIAGLSEGSSMVTSAATQVSSSSQSLAEGASEQAAAIEEVTSSIEEMASMTKQNAGNANEAKGLADTATAAADKGSQAMVRMSSAIDDIKKSSDKTAKIIKTIDEIAFQTNLLALNAAVEAARAGEAGKGFAVVAEEVRNLAQRSAEAARNTADMIESSVKNAENGVSISKEVGETLDEIATGTRKTNELVSEIAAASNEQSQGIEQINTAVTQMDSTTQSNAANAEESASASEEMSAQAEELNSMVGELQALVGGSSSRNAAQFKVDTTDKAVEHKAQAVTDKAAAKSSWKVDSPEDVIPLDSEKELSSF